MKTTITYEISYDAESDIEYIGKVGNIAIDDGSNYEVHRFEWVERYRDAIFESRSGTVDVWMVDNKIERDDYFEMPPREVMQYIEEYMRKHLV